MAKYVNENFDHFLSDKDHKKNIHKKNPVPKNNDPIKILVTCKNSGR